MKTATFCVIIIILATILRNSSSAQVRLTNLRCEYRSDPLSIDIAKPRLSWVIESSARGVMQSAYEVLVASSPKLLGENKGDLWESGKTASSQSNQIAYAGKPLGSRTACYWKVRIWDNHGHPTSYSASARWRMGLLTRADWEAQWIGLKTDTSLDLRPAPYVRREFVVKKPLRSALVYATARGLFLASLNGKSMHDDILSPGWTDYKQRINYCTYDVTRQIRQGSNCIGLIIGDGWYRGYVGFSRHPNHYGDQTSALLQLHLEYSDGTEEIIGTDASWKAAFGPILYSDLLMGEQYEGRLEPIGWDKPGFNDDAWQAAELMPPTEARLTSLPTEPVRIIKIIKPKKVSEPSKGTFVFDLGQNIAGFAQLKVRGKRGTEVVLRYAEVLNPDGTIYTTNLRSAKATDIYTLKGKGEEFFQPHFTFHGFRYIEVKGYPGKPSLDAILGCAISSDLPMAGSFSCSDPLVNQLCNNILWSQRANFISIPTDCPQRDERLGWMGDAQIFVRTAAFDMDVASFMTKWMEDVTDAQSPQGAFKDTSPYIEGNGTDGAPGWGDAGVIIPWYVYRCYGDTRIVQEHFQAMDRWMKYIADGNPDFVRRNRLNNNYGDWLSINAETPKELLATAFWAYDAELMSTMARAIGRPADELRYRTLFENIRTAFRTTYVSPGGQVAGKTQTGYLLCLAFDLIPTEDRQRVAQQLADDIKDRGFHLSTGFIGVKYLNPILTETGYADLAYRLLFNTTFPSWGYPITQGATTIWERWDGWTKENGFQDPGMNSFNHYSMGSVGEWLYRYVAGIDLDDSVPGYKQIVIHPRPTAKLKFAKAEYLSIQGMIRSQWKFEKGSLRFEITVPANSEATVYVPTINPRSVREGGRPIAGSAALRFLREEDGCAVYRVGSGSFSFESSLK